jgi:hypothetical protein
VKVATINVATLIGCVVLTAAVAVLAPGHQADPESRAPLHPLSALPAGAAFAVTLDLPQLRQGELGAALAGAGREVPGLGRLEDVCGFDPTSQIERLAIALPHSGAGANGRIPDFGLAATGSFDPARVVECARTVIARRGGAPVVSRIGTFVSVRDRTGKSTGEIAVREAGLVLVGGGTYLRNMIDAADGHIPSLRQDELHRLLRRSVGTDGAVVATWAPPAGWLERWLGLEESAHTPWSQVRAAGLKLDLSAGLSARLVVGCAMPQACRQIAQALESVLSDVAAPSSGSAPLSAMVKRTRIQSAQREVRVQISSTPDELALLLDAARAMLGWTTAPPSPAPVLSTPRPDEIVSPPPPPRSDRDTERRSLNAAAETGMGQRPPSRALPRDESRN